jgi:hypothetical protein
MLELCNIPEKNVEYADILGQNIRYWARLTSANSSRKSAPAPAP